MPTLDGAYSLIDYAGHSAALRRKPRMTLVGRQNCLAWPKSVFLINLFVGQPAGWDGDRVTIAPERVCQTLRIRVVLRYILRLVDTRPNR